MRHNKSDYTLRDLIACINSQFTTEHEKIQAQSELDHRKYFDESNIASVLPIN